MASLAAMLTFPARWHASPAERGVRRLCSGLQPSPAFFDRQPLIEEFGCPPPEVAPEQRRTIASKQQAEKAGPWRRVQRMLSASVTISPPLMLLLRAGPGAALQSMHAQAVGAQARRPRPRSSKGRRRRRGKATQRKASVQTCPPGVVAHPAILAPDQRSSSAGRPPSEPSAAAGSDFPMELSTLLVEVRLDLGDGTAQTVQVRAVDRCQEVAARFVEEHSLKSLFEAPLSAYLQRAELSAEEFPIKLQASLADIRRSFCMQATL